LFVLFTPPLLIFWLLAFTYLAAIYIASRNLELLESRHAKDLVLWYFGVGIATCFALVHEKKPDHLLWQLFADNLKAAAILSFVITSYTFGFFIELVLVPLATFILACKTVAESRKESHQVAKFFGVLQMLVGLAVISRAAISAWFDREQLLAVNTVWELVFPIWLTLVALPFWWFFALALNYEDINFRLRFFDKEREWSAYARNKIFQRFRFRLIPLKQFIREFHVHEISSTLDVDIQFAIAQRKVAERLRANSGEIIKIVRTEILQSNNGKTSPRGLQICWENRSKAAVRKVEAQLRFMDAYGAELGKIEYPIFATSDELPGVAPGTIYEPTFDECFKLSDDRVVAVEVQVCCWSQRGY